MTVPWQARPAKKNLANGSEQALALLTDGTRLLRVSSSNAALLAAVRARTEYRRRQNRQTRPRGAVQLVVPRALAAVREGLGVGRIVAAAVEVAGIALRPAVGAAGPRSCCCHSLRCCRSHCCRHRPAAGCGRQAFAGCRRGFRWRSDLGPIADRSICACGWSLRPTPASLCAGTARRFQRGGH